LRTRRPSRRAGGRLAAAALLAAVIAGAAALVLSGSSSPSHAAASATIPPGETTTKVARRTLSESETVDGTLGYGASTSIYSQLGGTFTWLPGAGHVISRGGALYRLDNLPVVLMYGTVPAYRRLAEGVSGGPDVAELNTNLERLGYGAVAGEDVFSSTTVAAIKRWQHAEGLRETGAVELGRVAFAPGALRVTEVHVALGQDPPGASEEAATEQERAEKEQAEKQQAEKEKAEKEKAEKEQAHKSEPNGSKPNHHDKTPQAASPNDKASNKEKASASPEKEGQGSKEQSPGGGAGELVLTGTSTSQLVTVKVKAEQQQLARVGERAPVTLPGGRTVTGRVTDVGTVASTPSSEESQRGGGGGGGGENEAPTITVTLALDRPVERLDQAPVSVELVKSIRRHVLTVPAAALQATAGGGYALSSLQGDRRVPVPVTPGMFAGGYVEVEGSAVHDGLTVLEPR
jgi:peptidoglycan hydrolase-like protein with peptidoglycan-binding domain